MIELTDAGLTKIFLVQNEALCNSALQAAYLEAGRGTILMAPEKEFDFMQGAMRERIWRELRRPFYVTDNIELDAKYLDNWEASIPEAGDKTLNQLNHEGLLDMQLVDLDGKFNVDNVRSVIHKENSYFVPKDKKGIIATCTFNDTTKLPIFERVIGDKVYFFVSLINLGSKHLDDDDPESFAELEIFKSLDYEVETLEKPFELEERMSVGDFQGVRELCFDFTGYEKEAVVKRIYVDWETEKQDNAALVLVLTPKKKPALKIKELNFNFFRAFLALDRLSRLNALNVLPITMENYKEHEALLRDVIFFPPDELAIWNPDGSLYSWMDLTIQNKTVNTFKFSNNERTFTMDEDLNQRSLMTSETFITRKREDLLDGSFIETSKDGNGKMLLITTFDSLNRLKKKEMQTGTVVKYHYKPDTMVPFKSTRGSHGITNLFTYDENLVLINSVPVR